MLSRMLACAVACIMAVAPALARSPSADEQAQIDSFVRGNLSFVLYHELGHALVERLGLPVLGREEDAVDGFATLLMLPEEPDPEADGLIIDAAFGWYLTHEASAGELAVDDLPYWDEHSLDMQRFYAIVCHLYGSDPEGFEEFAVEVGLPEERAMSCPDEFTRLAETWVVLLEPYLLPDGEGAPRAVHYDDAEPGDEALVDRLRGWGLLEQLALDAAAFGLDAPIDIAAGYCGEPNAFWVPDEGLVVLCYELVALYESLIRTELGL